MAHRIDLLTLHEIAMASAQPKLMPELTAVDDFDSDILTCSNHAPQRTARLRFWWRRRLSVAPSLSFIR